MVAASPALKSHWPVSILSTLSSLVSMALPLILVRSLEAETLGLFKIFFLYLMVLPPLTFIAGVSSGLAYWAGRGEEGLKAIRISSLLYIVISIATLAILLLFQNPLGTQLNISKEWLTLFAFGLFFGIASLFYDEASIATGRIWMGAIFNSGFEFLRTGVIVATAVITHDLVAIIKAHIVVQAIKVITGYSLAYRQGLFNLEWDKNIFIKVKRYAFPVSLAFVFGLGLNYSDQIILSRTISNAEFALYALCCLTVPPLLVLEASVTRVLIPQLSQAFSDESRSRAALFYRKSVHELAFLIIPSAVGMIVFAPAIIELLFTNAYIQGAHFLQLYAFWYLTLIIPQDAIARARGEARWILGNFISFSVITLVLCGVFAHFYGAEGALLGLLIARFSSRFYTIYYMKRTLSAPVLEFIPLQSLVKITSISVALGAVCFLSQDFFSSRITWFFVSGSGFALTYLLLSYFFASERITQDRKVLMLTPGLFIGGLERMILNLSKSLKYSTPWQPQVLAYDASPAGISGANLIASFQSFEIPVQSKAKPARFSLKTVIQIAGQTSRDGVTVIHTHDLGALIYGALAKLLLFRKVRLVHTQHSFVHINRSWKYRYYEKFFTWFADSLAVVSEDTRRGYLKLGIAEKKLHVIPNGVDFPDHPELDRSKRIEKRHSLINGCEAHDQLIRYSKEIWILYMARIHRGKGQDHALKVWDTLQPGVREKSILVFVGPETEFGALKKLKSEITQSSHSERIIVAGATQYPHEWTRACDLFLSSSEFEGMPLSPVEALGSGVPTVLSKIPGHSFLSTCAELYSLEAPRSGAETIERMIDRIENDDINFRKELWNVTEGIRSSFTLSAMSKQYVKLYEAEI